MKNLILSLTKLHNQKRDNRGSSIVIVIIATAMIGILASSILWTAYMNYMIKINDIKNKSGFYDAEMVTEQIMAGVQNQASKAVAIAYQDVINNWEYLGSEENRYNAFATKYVDTLIENLSDGTPGSGVYNRDVLRSYVDAEIFTPTDCPGVDVAAWTNGNATGEVAKPPVIELVNNSNVVLKNLYISYTDVNGRLSIVQTDICLDVPQIVFTQGGEFEWYEYQLIGNKGVHVTKSCGQVTTDGSIFAGYNEDDKAALYVDTASNLIVNNAKDVIAQGDVIVNGAGSAFTIRNTKGTTNRLYADGINLQSGAISVDGTAYVADDLVLNGSGSKATFAQKYYGYGTSVNNGLDTNKINPGKSSAVIINGKNSTVDFSKLTTLLLGGRAYISNDTVDHSTLTKEELEALRAAKMIGTDPETNAESQSIMMGESIAVKGGQIAYLVPSECIGVNVDGLVIGQNPISAEQYAKVKAYQDQGDTENYDETFKEVDFTKPVYRLGGKPLSYYGVTSMKNIRKVSIQYTGGGATNKNLTYYYLVLDRDKTAEYFQQYYMFNSNKDTIDSYFDIYASGGIMLGDPEKDGNQYTILGNSLVSSALADNGVTLLKGTDTKTTYDDPVDGFEEITDENVEDLINAKTDAEIENFASGIAAEYKSLCYTLKKNKTPSESDIKDNKVYVFNSLIKEEELNNYFTSKTKTALTFKTADGLMAYVCKGDVTLTSIPDYQKVRLIISEGNVTVNKNYTGMIIAKGTITLDSGAAVLARDNMELYKVLDAKLDEVTLGGAPADNTTPMSFFVGSGMAIGGSGKKAEVDEHGDLDIDYTEIVRYQNWIKK